METRYNSKHDHYLLGRLPHHADVETYFQQHYSPEGTVLELGAGTGMGTAALSSYFRKVIAVEPVEEMFGYAQGAVAQTNVTFINSDVECLDVDHLAYDYLVCFQATHWFYEAPNYQALYTKAKQPVIDVCSFISFPEGQPFFDKLAKANTVPQSDRGTKYPFDVAQEYVYQQSIGVDHAAHQLCSRSWVDHTNFGKIRTQIAERYADRGVLADINTRIHTVHLN